jgi:hypothetical protein
MGKTRGSSEIFTEHELKQLESNPNVQHVTDRTIKEGKYGQATNKRIVRRGKTDTLRALSKD